MIYVNADTKPVIVRRLRRDGEPIPGLDTASSITWKAKKPSGAIISKACSITDLAKAEVTVAALVAADFNENGLWYEEIVILWSAGNTEHPENPGKFIVRAEFTEAAI